MHATIDSPSHALTVLVGIRRALAESVNLGQIKNFRDQAEAVRHFVKTAALGLEMQNQAGEMKLVAERRAGEILKDLGLHGGDRKSDHRNNGAGLNELGITKVQSSCWQREASLPEDDFQEYLRQTKRQGKELTSRGLLRLARLFVEATEAVFDPASSLSQMAGKLRDLARRQAPFRCIYVTPPWPNGRKAKTSIRQRVQELAALPVKGLAAERGHLHLWTTPELLEDGLRLLRAWGFRYRASLVRTKSPTDYGSYWRQSHEILLLGVRGGLAFRDSDLPSWIEGHLASSTNSLREIHSLIERVSHGPYLELFGSKPESGWTVIESPSSSALPASQVCP